MGEQNYYWYPCPHCGKHKMQRMRRDTKVENFPAYCKRCKTESIISILEPPRQVVNQ
ncbi:MAG: conjugal transfer protein [Lachnospiraceae bacterium]|nr:conjugal transfer protein [Lachnospiraceae bacterium]